MVTTIQTSKELKEALDKQKFSKNETYEDVIWDLIEDRMELSTDAKRRIARAEDDIRNGRVHKWEDVKIKYGL